MMAEEQAVDLTSGRASEIVKDWETLRAVLSANGEVSRVAMWLLRDLEDKGRLGVHVRTAISNRLAGLGLGHLPVDLPPDQNDVIMVYKRGTPAANIIEAIYLNGTGTVAEFLLRRLNTEQEAQILAAVRDKVAELHEMLGDPR